MAGRGGPLGTSGPCTHRPDELRARVRRYKRRRLVPGVPAETTIRPGKMSGVLREAESTTLPVLVQMEVASDS